MRILLALAVGFASCAWAAEVAELKAPSGIYHTKNGKLEKIGEAEAHDTFTILGKTGKGGWVKVNYNGRVGWIPAKRVDIYPSGSRAIASTRGGSASHPGTGSAQAGVLLETSGIGVGIGGGAHFKVPVDLPKNYRLDAGLILAFFPSVSSGGSATASSGGTSVTTTATASASAVELLAQGRLLIEIQPGLELGGDLGFFYRKFSVPSVSVSTSGVTTPTTLNATGSGGSNFSIQFGGLASYGFAQDFHVTGGLRCLLASPTTLQFHAGVEYRF